MIAFNITRISDAALNIDTWAQQRRGGLDQNLPISSAIYDDRGVFLTSYTSIVKSQKSQSENGWGGDLTLLQL